MQVALEDLERGDLVDETLSEFQGFSGLSFSLLKELSLDPTQRTYRRLKDQLISEVKRPMEMMLKALAPSLEIRFPDLIETRKRTTSNFRKNDFGRGGYYPYLWGAFYRKGLTRRLSPQLFIKIHPTQVQIGFALGNQTHDYFQILRQTLQSEPQKYESLFKKQIWFHDESYEGNQSSRIQSVQELTDQLQKKKGFCLMRVLSHLEVIDLGADFLQEVEQVFRWVLPLFLISVGKKPYYPHLLVQPNQLVHEAPVTLPQTPVDQPAHTHVHSALQSSVRSIQDLLQRVHLESTSNEGRLIRSVYEASIQPDEFSIGFRQMIFKGPPGTGKTFIAQSLAELYAQKPENIVKVQFHPSYAYEDFVGGIRPVISESGESHLFRFEAGIFKRLCDRALLSPHENFVMVIDEINRANVSSVFGELLWALEYRGQSVSLPFTEDGKAIQFQIPKNIFLIGTMNSADRSIALMDYAIRRRFKFISIHPNVEVLDHLLGNLDVEWKEKVKQLFLLLNQKLKAINPDLCIGHSYFRPWPGDQLTEDGLEKIWQLSILPLIQEYFYGESDLERFQLSQLKRELT